MIKLQLHENWQLCNIRQLDWIPAQVPGDIYAALLKTGKMPDPFFGDNEYQAKALMEEDTKRYLIMKKRSLKIVRK